MNDDRLKEKRAQMLLRETYYLTYLPDDEIDRKLLKFSDSINRIIQNNKKSIDPVEIENLNKNIKFNEIVNEIKVLAMALQRNLSFETARDLKRYRVRLLVQAEEKILDLIQYYAPNTAKFIREKLGVSFKEA